MIFGVRTRITEPEARRTAWEGRPQRVRALYSKRKGPAGIQSTAGHEESRGKTGGPPSKPKYYLMTDREAVP